MALKKYIFIIFSFFFFLILVSLFYLLIIERNPSEIPSNLLNKAAPDFESKEIFSNNKFFFLKEVGEKKLIVNFFATWCVPCIEEHKFFMELSKKEDIKIIGINYKDNSEKTIEWLSEKGNPYNLVAIDKKGKVAINWGVYGIPETFIIDKSGIIKFRLVGPITKKNFKKINQIIDDIN
jgi:cytochrome c biogenesis protein CcmG, thiol:disulfide interchange protein DsbE